MMLVAVRSTPGAGGRERYHFECPNCGNDLVQTVSSDTGDEPDSQPFVAPDEDTFPIGALAKASGATVETIRYYERIGLLKSPPRSAGGRRVYSNADLRTLVFIRRARDLAFSLDEIATLLGLGTAQKVTCEEVQKIASRHLDEIRAKLRDLSKLESILATTVSRCPGDASTECPVLDMLDAAHNEPFPMIDQENAAPR